MSPSFYCMIPYTISGEPIAQRYINRFCAPSAGASNAVFGLDCPLGVCYENSAMKNIIDKLPGIKALVLGDIILDCYIWGDATRISPEAPVPVVEISSESFTMGGAANVAANVRALGCSVEVFGTIGQDQAADTLIDLFSKRNILFSDSICRTSAPTIRKTRVMVQHQQLCRLDHEAAPAAYTPNRAICLKAVLNSVKSCDVVIMADYAKGFLDNTMIDEVTRAARAAGKLVALDPKPRPSLAFSQQDVITPNRRESLQLAGIELRRHDKFPAEAVCKAIWEKHKPRYLVVTLGEEGMLLSENGLVTKSMPTMAREVFDVSGAGDTVISALSTALATGCGLTDAAHFANVAAGVVIGKLGTATASPAEILAHASNES